MTKNVLKIKQLEPKNLKEIRDFLENFLQRNNIREDNIFILKLALDEVCQNVIRYSYREEPLPLEITLNIEKDNLVISIRDFAKQKTTLEDFKPRDLDDIKAGGLGTTLIKNAVDEMYFSKNIEKGNCLNLIKKIT